MRETFERPSDNNKKIERCMHGCFMKHKKFHCLFFFEIKDPLRQKLPVEQLIKVAGFINWFYYTSHLFI